MNKNLYTKKLQELSEKITSREDLHEEFIGRMHDILLDFSVDFGHMMQIDSNPSVSCIQAFIEQWVNLHFCKREE